MKVVQINSECDRGSTGKIAVAISKLLTQQNVENYIFYSGNHKSKYPLGIQINSKLDLRIHQLLSRIFGDQGWHSYFSTKRMVKQIKRIDPDFIHLHNIHGYYLHFDVLMKYLISSKKPVIWTLHDCWAFTGHCTHFLKSNCEKWKSECYQCPSKSEYPYSLFFDRSKELFIRKRNKINRIDNLTIVTPSKWLADLVKESFLSKARIEVIHNGIDLSVFTPNSTDDTRLDKKFTILGVSSVWRYGKGLDIFCQLAKRLDMEKYQIILIGTDERIDKVLDSSIISIHRTQNQKQLVEYYSKADLFLNPTREDNYPTVNMEAIACGTPVMTFSTGGSVESIIGDENMIIKSNSIEETVQKIENYAQCKPITPEMCREKAIEFDEKKCFIEYLKLYGLKIGD